MQPGTATTVDPTSPPPPVWLVRLTLASAGLAALAVCVFVWAKWGTLVAMSEDAIKFCF